LSRLSRAVERIDLNKAVFGLRDSSGASMETLKIVPYDQGYLGVYHHRVGGNFEVRLATSTNLKVWHYWSRLDDAASQPTLTAVKGGGYLLAVEAEKRADLGPGKRWLRFQHYRDLQDLLSGRADRSFDAPHTLTAADRGAEGTPNIYSATVHDGDIGNSEIRVGFHFLRDGVDRQARGVLTNFSSWTASRDVGLDRVLDEAGMWGKHGDRDTVDVDGGHFSLIEAQKELNAPWQVALLDSRSNTVRRLTMATPGRSRSFANPTLVRADLPDGQPGLIVTLYLPREGAAPGEAGELVYYNKL